MLFVAALAAFAQAAAQEPAASGVVRGRVVDARGGEPLARVRARLVNAPFETQTDADGRFAFEAVPAGDHVLQVETVGYRLVKQPFTVSRDRAAFEFDIALSPDTFQRTDNVDVKAGQFEVSSIPAPADLNLTGSEIKNLGTVLMDDPMRAVHALPGVSATNDYQSQFTLRGTSVDRIGLYVDGVLLHSPYHEVGGGENYGSLSILDAEVVSDMALLPMNAPPNFGDRTGAVLSMQTRDGSTAKPSLRIGAGVAGLSAIAEGPLRRGRGSWLVSARKSYLQYLINRLTTDSAVAIGFTDYQGKLSLNLPKNQKLSLYALDGTTDLDRSAAINRSGVNAIINGRTRSSMGRAAWTLPASPTLVLEASGAWLREHFETTNKQDRLLDLGAYGEWVGNMRASWQWMSGNTMDAGWTTRRLRDDGRRFSYFNDPTRIQLLDTHRGTARRDGAYFDQTWQAARGALRGSVGLRWDGHELYAASVASPQASLAVRLPAAGELQLAWGQYVQFPELAVITSPYGGLRIAPERANHVSAAIEKRFWGDARVRVEAWNRDDRDLIARPLFDPRLINGVAVVTTNGQYFNSVRGYSRGGQIMIQRRSANRLSGWVSYTLGYARQRDEVEKQHFWATQDQRHIANVYLSYRITSSLNLSGRWSYSSGECIPGYVEQRNGLYYLSRSRNVTRLPAYQRLDIRANKSFTYDRWKLTVYGEVINLTNRYNVRFVSFDGANAATQRASITTDRVFPIVPVAGVTLEF